jgi:ribosome-associated protein
LETVEMARMIVEAASDRQASDIILMDTRQACSFADYFVICNGETGRQIEAIGKVVDDVLKKEGIIPHHREGTADSGWVLFDLGGVIVHIFAPFEREYYQLEKMWGKAQLLLRIM